MEPPPAARRRPRRSAAVLRPPTYAESESDVDAPLRLRRWRRKTLESLEKETHTEALIALSLGFPVDSLRRPHETLIPGFSLNDYLVIRNHILSLWRRHSVRCPLPLESLKETISADYDPLVSAAYDFLSTHGFINFGITRPLRLVEADGNRGGSVIIVGAGLSGLAAARQLLQFGYKVVILEGKTRPGGRVYTTKLGKDGRFAAVELGGSVITGTHANPLAVLARQIGAPLHKIRDRCPLFYPDGAEVDQRLDLEVDAMFNKLLDRASELREAMGEFADGVSLGDAVDKMRKLYGVARSKEEKEVLDWHFANLEYANAGCLSDLSLAHWDQDDPYEMDGDHCFLAGGNWRLISGLCEDVPILYGKKVVRIEYGDDSGVEVAVEGGQVFQADMVLCTVSLGVLKSGSIRFEPELPARKKEAVERLGFGLLNKIAMLFPFVFWGEDLDTFGCLNRDSRKRGEFFLFYSYHTVSAGAVLIALVAGEAALEFERTDPVVLLHRVLGIIRGIFKPRSVDVPDPIQTVCTKWGSDPLCQGSYSHVRVGSSGNDYDILAESIGGRLFFAGEATNRQYPATMQGAFLSGLREAASILRASKDRADGNNDSKKCSQKNLKQYTDSLMGLFKEPDISFGRFDFVFDPFTTEDPTATGFMRVTFEKSRTEALENGLKLESKRLQQLSDRQFEDLHFYAMLSREQMLQIQLVSEDDKSKLEILCKKFGLKLMGFDSACALGSSLIISISTARRAWNRLHRTKHYKL